jgi:replicative DNA helicase
MNNGFMKNTEVLMFNGELKKIQDIQIGDLVMSEDNGPLKVTNIKTDINELYNVAHYYNDENYIVNKDFELSLTYIYKKSIIDHTTYYSIKWLDNDTLSEKFVKFSYNKKNKKKIYNSVNAYFENIKENRQVNIKVCDFMNLSLNLQSKLHGIKSLITFYPKKTPINSYMIGNIEGINIYGMVDNNTISDIYKYNSTHIRFDYLAGVIDGYGYVQNDKYILEIPEYNSYVKDLIFIIKSVLLNCTYKDGLLIIYGNKIVKIPTKNLKITSKLNKYSNKIQIDNYGIDTYYTLQFNKESKFILGNCIVV